MPVDWYAYIQYEMGNICEILQTIYFVINDVNCLFLFRALHVQGVQYMMMMYVWNKSCLYIVIGC